MPKISQKIESKSNFKLFENFPRHNFSKISKVKMSFYMFQGCFLSDVRDTPPRTYVR